MTDICTFIEQTLGVDHTPQRNPRPRITWTNHGRVNVYETPEWSIRVDGGRYPYVQVSFTKQDAITPDDLRRLFAVVDWLHANGVEFNTYTYQGDQSEIMRLRRRASE